ncbi:MAG: hypothetical protein ABIR70_00335 [Bryobacteraceae bacterium]
MTAQNLTEAIQSLTTEQQQSVYQFIDFLKRKGDGSPISFLAAADEFMSEHPEILRRLAQ